MPNDLNLAWSQRVAAAIAPLALLGLVAAPAALAAGFPWVAGALSLPVLASLAFHLPMIRFFKSRAGILFGIGGWAFHQVHLTYSAVTMAVLVLERALGRGPRREARRS
jgi:hypothetical protein